MQNYLLWTLALAVVALLSVGVATFARSYLGGTTPSPFRFRAKSERRLEVVDHTSIDGRRKLILIRRDDVEHLVMTGGPVDVVIETGISTAGRRIADAPAAKGDPLSRRYPGFAPSMEPPEPGTAT